MKTYFKIINPDSTAIFAIAAKLSYRVLTKDKESPDSIEQTYPDNVGKSTAKAGDSESATENNRLD